MGSVKGGWRDGIDPGSFYTINFCPENWARLASNKRRLQTTFYVIITVDRTSDGTILIRCKRTKDHFISFNSLFIPETAIYSSIKHSLWCPNGSKRERWEERPVNESLPPKHSGHPLSPFPAPAPAPVRYHCGKSHMPSWPMTTSLNLFVFLTPDLQKKLYKSFRLSDIAIDIRIQTLDQGLSAIARASQVGAVADHLRRCIEMASPHSPLR